MNKPGERSHSDAKSSGAPDRDDALDTLATEAAVPCDCAEGWEERGECEHAPDCPIGIAVDEAIRVLLFPAQPGAPDVVSASTLAQRIVARCLDDSGDEAGVILNDVYGWAKSTLTHDSTPTGSAR